MTQSLGFFAKYKFIELKANSKAVPEREGGKPQVWRKGLKPSPRGEGVEQSETDEG